jgi:hypothetical protein
MSESTELEVHAPASTAIAPSEWSVMCAQADVLSRAKGVVPRQYVGRPEDIIAAALYGRSVGFDVTTSMRTIHVIDGKPSFAADALVALIRNAGHSLSGETSATSATARGKRRDTGDEMAVTWTMAEAKAAGLAGKGNWSKYPQSMLWARAVSQLCRMLFADVTLGMAYTPEELAPDVPVDESGNVIEGTVVGDWDAAAEQQHAERSQRPAPSPEMAAWAQSLTVDRLAKWEAWKAAHDGWHRNDSGLAEAYIVLRDLSAQEDAATGDEPFAVGEAADREDAEGPSPALSTSPTAAPHDDVLDAEVVPTPPRDDGLSPLVSRPLVSKVQIACGQIGLNGRTERLRWATAQLGRDIATFNDLTVLEAEQLINAAALAASKAPDA